MNPELPTKALKIAQMVLRNKRDDIISHQNHSGALGEAFYKDQVEKLHDSIEQIEKFMSAHSTTREI